MLRFTVAAHHAQTMAVRWNAHGNRTHFLEWNGCAVPSAAMPRWGGLLWRDAVPAPSHHGHNSRPSGCSSANS